MIYRPVTSIVEDVERLVRLVRPVRKANAPRVALKDKPYAKVVV